METISLADLIVGKYHGSAAFHNTGQWPTLCGARAVRQKPSGITNKHVDLKPLNVSGWLYSALRLGCSVCPKERERAPALPGHCR